jgi:hypothetical protein
MAAVLDIRESLSSNASGICPAGNRGCFSFWKLIFQDATPLGFSFFAETPDQCQYVRIFCELIM